MLHTTTDKIMINFGWKGPNIWSGGSACGDIDVTVVDLIFKGAKTEISVHLPRDINPVSPQKFPFICSRYRDTGARKVKLLAKTTHPELLRVTVEQIRNLTIKAGFFEKGRPIEPMFMHPSTGKITQQQSDQRTDRIVALEIPDELEIGQTYNLVVTSDNLSLSARLFKEVMADDAERIARRDDFTGRVRRMGGVLIEEGLQNLELASKGGAGVFDSTSTTADIFAHGMRGVIHAGQEVHPGIEVPYTKPTESPSDLDELSAEELQSRFDETYKKDKEFECQRMTAARAGNLDEMNKIIKAETANSQLLINLAEALERKGIKAQIPQSDSFRSVARDAAELHTDALNLHQEECKVQ